MAITEQNWQEEQLRVEEVGKRLGQRIDELENEIGSVKSDALEIRKHFWDEVTVNFSNAEDVTETYFSMKQQADVLSERERSHRQAAAALDKLKRLRQSPYFGRIDFTEMEDSEFEKIYLGIASFRMPGSDAFLIYDWRAPISSLYYDYPPGPAAYVTPSGQIQGELLLKRQFVIRDGRISLLFDTGVTIGDELLKQMLSRTSDAQMKSIVATIQKEQNRIIRNDQSRMLIVQGAAGSGKTSAALQRVAYLLYKHRDTLRADQMVLFSPNPMFNSYVSSVLPELGEENMLQTTFQEYMESRLGAEFELEDPFDQLEYVLAAADMPGDPGRGRMEGIRYKSSPIFVEIIKQYVEQLEEADMRFKSVKFRGRTILSAERIGERFYAFDSSIKLANRVVLLREWLLEEIKAFEKEERKAPWVEEEIDLLDNEAYQRAYNKLRKMQKGKEETFNDYVMEKQLLARVVVSEHLKPLRRRIKQLRFVDVRGIYRRLFADWERLSAAFKDVQLPERWNAIADFTVKQLDEGKLSYEDITPYLFLNERLKGFRTNTSVRYVLIDEAQDYSPFQLEFLKWLFPRAGMTALGDLNQSIYAGTSAMNEQDPLAALYGPQHTAFINLTRSYRSTKEIVEFTRGMVPGGEAIVPFNRSGDKPAVEFAQSNQDLNDKIASRIQSLLDNEFDSIAIICKTAAESRDAFEALNARIAVRLVTKHTPSFERGVQIIPAYLAKGVEFDTVLIYNGSKSAYNHEHERKLFYTACTRAMHLLHIFVQGELSPFLADLPVENYVTYSGEGSLI